MERDLEALPVDSKLGPPPSATTTISSAPESKYDASLPPRPDEKTGKQWTITISLPTRADIGSFKLKPVYERPTLSQPARIFGIRRRWFLAGLGLLALIILIIGLAAGLSGKKKNRTFLPLPASGQTFHGEATYYDTGLGACGWDNSGKEPVVAVSHLLWDAKNVGGNPNNNPLCGLMIRATRYRANNEAYLIGQSDNDAPGGRNVSVDVKIVDRCVGCKPTDLDFSRSAFDALADQAMGRVTIDWAWL